jgi:(1->4)-alpha-D-glucan 1-alpha-D-glucosylmutase
MTPLRATARLQLHAGFTLHDAAERAPYYAALGVSHLYLSPIGAAVPGSTHGYDAIDPTRVNPEIGGEDALSRLGERVRELGMGLVLDIVPNHVAAHADNPWWWDVLRHGRESRYATWFDIDWDAPGCDGRLWLPVLDAPCVEVLARSGLTVATEPDVGVVLRHGEQRFPLQVDGLDVPREPEARAAWAGALTEDARAGGVALRRLLDRQPYRLAWWRTGHDRINYRRFFDITSLVALRTELPDVFAAVHALPLRLIRAGLVDALRIDHIDGLADPRGYLHRLRHEVDLAARDRGVAPGQIALFVEKILAPGEALPTDWPCDGTTGYDFMNQVGGLLHDPRGEAALRALWGAHGRRSGDFAEEERTARRQMLAGPLHAEFLRALRSLEQVLRTDPVAAELGPECLRRALAALMIEYPVYRTYAAPDGLRGDDAERFAAVAERAGEGASPALRAAIACIARCMHDETGIDAPELQQRRMLRQRLEQLSAPLNAKAVEDTAFYRYGVLLSRNEVGSHPTHFSLPQDAFHVACDARAERWPRALLITASHDHKRGEDVRARLAVLSERAEWWVACMEAFGRMGEPLREDPHAPTLGDTLMLWQTFVAAWPLDLAPHDAEGMHRFARRVADWQFKAMREAKLNTNWTDPDERYEAASRAFLDRVLLAPEGEALRTALHDAALRIGPAGALNGLVQTTLRLTVPGTPDLYQGTEGWDLSLVDPDNRRPVDYDQREAWLHDAGDWPQLLARWRDAAAKARLVARLLQLRQQAPELFARGDYQPVHCEGPLAAHVIAFQRDDPDRRAVAEKSAGLFANLFVAVPRCISHWLEDRDRPHPDPSRWNDAAFTLPDGRWRHVLEQRDFTVADRRLALSQLFLHSPIAVLIRTA